MLQPQVEELKQMAIYIASLHDIPARLFVHIPQVESDWRPWATRYEPQFGKFFLPQDFDPDTTNATEREHQRTSWGLCQVMGWTARRHDYRGPLPALCDPQTGLEYGARELRMHYIDSGSWRWAITAYNHGPKWVEVNPHWDREGYTLKFQPMLDSLGEP